MERAASEEVTISYLPMQIIQLVLLLLGPSDLLSCRRVCQTWKNLINSVKLWDKIPIPKNFWNDQLIWHFNPIELSSFLTKFRKIDLIFTNLPLDYVREMSQALERRSQPMTYLNLHGNKLYDLSYSELETNLTCSYHLNLSRCKINH